MTIPATRKAPCRAKDPHTCPYHGAVLQMEEAAQKGDLDAYFTARQKVEASEALGWVDDQLDIGPEPTVEISMKQIENELAKFEEKYNDMFYSNRYRAYSPTNNYSNFAEALINNYISYSPTRKEVKLGKLGGAKVVNHNISNATDGDEVWIVFSLGGHYYKLSGTYSSWDNHDWYTLHEVEPETKIETKVEHGYRVIK